MGTLLRRYKAHLTLLQRLIKFSIRMWRKKKKKKKEKETRNKRLKEKAWLIKVQHRNSTVLWSER